MLASSDAIIMASALGLTEVGRSDCSALTPGGPTLSRTVACCQACYSGWAEARLTLNRRTLATCTVAFELRASGRKVQPCGRAAMIELN